VDRQVTVVTCLWSRISKQDSLSGQLEKFSRQQPTIASASSLIQSLLKEGDVIKLTEDEQCQTCSILCTSEYCMETTQQLEDKLKEKVDKELVEKIDLRAEQDIFHKWVSRIHTVYSQLQLLISSSLLKIYCFIAHMKFVSGSFCQNLSSVDCSWMWLRCSLYHVWQVITDK